MARLCGEGSLRIDGIQAGTYHIRAEKPGLQTVTLPLEIRAQTETRVIFKLQEQAQALAFGSVLINDAPSGAQVSLDGRPLGITSEAGAANGSPNNLL